ncbi:hypothetical protein HHK36_033281 [Tetracentron sinense]|uniref:Laccase n=1 Tax=Tetracentron sinense TaxID=13715 RepID=A0A835CZP1_TETSI|nr:hypothetical protein HHK36_033281 [Tetracentron sinense]
MGTSTTKVARVEGQAGTKDGVFGLEVHIRLSVEKLTETSYTRLCSTKNILTVNGQFPGPEIHVHKGDTVILNVTNNGNYNVTLHWHGVKQPRNPWSDGPEYITQCPIKPGANFTYEIKFSSEEGTLWWHAHSDWSRATVHGAIIVYPENGTSYPFPNPHAEETIIFAIPISDDPNHSIDSSSYVLEGSWYKGDVMEIIEEALEKGGEPNLSDAFTINGQPGDLYDCSKPGTFRMLVEYGKTYLLRMVNAGMNEELFFSIAQHQLTVVGTDGAYIKPLTVDYLMITPGQTMDVLLEADQSSSHYYMAARAYSSGTGVPFDNTTTTAILQYSGNYTVPSSLSLPYLPYYNDTAAVTNFTRGLRSLASEDHPIAVPKTVDTRVYTTISMSTYPCANNSCDGPNGSRVLASMSNISFVTPSIDILGAYYNQISGVYDTDFPNEPPYFFNFTADEISSDLLTPTFGTKVIVVEYNSSVEIVIQGTNLLSTAENHPMHLHGYNFYLVGSGFGNFNNVTDPNGYNLVDPPEVNTVGIPKNGWTAIRFLADNPGKLIL